MFLKKDVYNMQPTATHLNYFHIHRRKLGLFANGINMGHSLANAILLPLSAFYYTMEELKLLCQYLFNTFKPSAITSSSFTITGTWPDIHLPIKECKNIIN